MTGKISKLQREYADLHQRVLRAYRKSDNPPIAALQAREQEIVTSLRALGSTPYPQQKDAAQ
ncbi:hypothetical protein [Mesorhizobium sp.]|uniref:hypothetical protein n=1 Tax=Mesorhizobium sp. TaxID=1871066 RepID=UPI0025E53F63|nr:hypothetical protein [Mesorhizobium sp.]